MNRNHEIAEQFDEIADRQTLLRESWFKIRAYRQAAELMRATDQDVALLSSQGRLRELDGIGDAIADKTAEYLATGHIGLLDRLRDQVPRGQLEMLHAGLTPAQVREVWGAGITTMDALMQALAARDSRLTRKTQDALRRLQHSAEHA